MYPDIKELHSYWAFGVLFFLLIAVLNSLVGLSKNKPFAKNDRSIALIALIFSHVQMLLGIIMLCLSTLWETAKHLDGGIMHKDVRLYLVEHPLINIIALVLITIGWSKHKKAETDNAKFKKITVFYAIGLVLLLSRIPWSAWLS
ncbi:hypothetical protein ACLI09_14965 [Flavobacterium sp. RHBU_24]|uniref:hypothetical protein n=1 Tax=Flavobacterium sp. RHBU_24 TaxID=3391185 RepID=UPI003984EFCE